MFLRWLGVVWCLTIISLVLAFTAYLSRPGELGLLAESWPQDAVLQRSSGSPTLVVFINPHCPCTPATLANLERCLARCQTPVVVKIVIVRGSDRNLLEGSARRLAQLPEVEFFWDGDGVEVERFAVKTSGTVLVFTTHGQLEFSGGITPARGHEGDTSGTDAILCIASGKTAGVHNAVVYGCRL